METKVQPIINKYWSDDAFPFELLPSFKELGLGGLGFAPAHQRFLGGLPGDEVFYSDAGAATGQRFPLCGPVPAPAWPSWWSWSGRPGAGRSSATPETPGDRGRRFYNPD